MPYPSGPDETVASFSFTSASSFNPLKFPLSYAEAVARPDAPVWFAEMEREKMSLREMGAFCGGGFTKGRKDNRIEVGICS